MKIHEIYMKRALDLATRGAFQAIPNPSVGCVIVHQNRVIGEGFTSTYGGPHAEINALNSVGEQDKELIPFSTVYVTLEPCAHYGKTPPCALRLVQERVKEVFIGVLDPNPKVAGKGVLLLKQANIITHVGLLSKACERHHRHFIQSILKQRSYVTLKWAESKDGFIAPKFSDLIPQKIHWISNTWSQQYVHKLRALHPAILVGSQTLLNDNPALTTRHWAGKSPERFVLSCNQSMHLTNLVTTSQSFTVLCIGNKLTTTSNHQNATKTSVVHVETLSEALAHLYESGYPSVLVEGGSKTLQSFIDADLWNEAYVFRAEKKLNEGIRAPSAPFLKPLFVYREDQVLHSINSFS